MCVTLKEDAGSGSVAKLEGAGKLFELGGEKFSRGRKSYVVGRRYLWPRSCALKVKGGRDTRTPGWEFDATSSPAKETRSS